MPLSYLTTKKMQFITDYVYHPLFSVLDKYKKEKTILSYINYRGLQLEATTVNRLLLFRQTVETGIITDQIISLIPSLHNVPIP